MSEKKPQIHKTSKVAESRLFKIEKLQLEFANGEQREYERLVAGHGAVLIVPMINDDEIFMIREYSAGIHSYELTLPKGKMEPDESIENAANREIMEEIGYGANKLTHLTSLTLAPGYIDHYTHIVLAENLYPQKQVGDEPEPLDVVKWKLNDIHELILRDDCTEARTLAALFIMQNHLNKRMNP